MTSPAKSGADGPPATSVLIADSFRESGLAALGQLGCAVTCDPALDGDSLVAAVGEKDPDVLIVRSTKVPGEVFEAASRLSVVIRAGAGYDTIAVGAASRSGVAVANCPGMNAIAVAELAWGLILSCDRRIPDQTADLHAEKWAKKTYAKARGLYGRTLGIVGFGRIGQEVADRGKAFGMNVVVSSRSLTKERAEAAGVEYCDDLLELVKTSDVISIHVAATEATRHLVNEAFCAALRPGAVLVNTSRGSVVDESALIGAIRDKNVRVGLDVYANEPTANAPTFTSAIMKEPCVFGSHHVGASTDQAQDAIAEEAVRIVASWVSSGDVPNCVNHAESTAASTLLTVRHLNRPGVLAHVFELLGATGLNIEEMQNIVFAGGQAALAQIQINGRADEGDLERIREHEAVLSVAVSDIPGAGASD